MVVGFLAAAAMLAIHRGQTPGTALARPAHPDGRPYPDGPAVPCLVTWSGFAVIAAALVPIRRDLRARLPFTMEAVVLPRWLQHRGAESFPPGRVVLSYPAPFSGHSGEHGLAGRGCHGLRPGWRGRPEGVPNRAGSAPVRASWLWPIWPSGINVPQPTGTSARAGGRTARGSPSGGLEYRGHRPRGRVTPPACREVTPPMLPLHDRGARDAAPYQRRRLGVGHGQGAAAARVARGQIAACVAKDEKAVASTHASLRLARCHVGGGPT